MSSVDDNDNSNNYQHRDNLQKQAVSAEKEGLLEAAAPATTNVDSARGTEPLHKDGYEYNDQHGQHDLTLRALQLAAVSGLFSNDGRDIDEDGGGGGVGDQEQLMLTCLAMCNAFRDGVPVGRMVINKDTAVALVTALFPDIHRPPGDDDTKTKEPIAIHSTTTTTRVLPQRRVLALDMEWVPLVERDHPDGGWTSSVLSTTRSAEEKTHEGNDFSPFRDYDCTTAGVLTAVRWPEGVKAIRLSDFDQPLQDVTWPDTLETLVFLRSRPTPWGNIWNPLDAFNQPIVGVSWPAGLREIYLGEHFDQPIEKVDWPEGLQLLSMPGFTGRTDGARWPAGLHRLELTDPSNVSGREQGKVSLDMLQSSFRPGFNHSIAEPGVLPPGLRSLWLSESFNQEVDTVAWPSQLEELAFGASFGQNSLAGVVWPSSLKRLYLVRIPQEHDVGDNLFGRVPAGCGVFVLEAQLLAEGPGYEVFDLDGEDSEEFDSDPEMAELMYEYNRGDDY